MLFNFTLALTLRYHFTEAVQKCDSVFGDVTASALFMSEAASKIPDAAGSTELRMSRKGQALGLEMLGRGCWTTEYEVLDI